MGSTFDRVAFGQRLGTRRLGRTLVTRGTVGSTNDLAWEACAAGAPDGTTVVADAQTGGRGRAGRVWHTTPGRSLALSLLLRPAGDRRAAGMLPLAAGLAVAQALESLGARPGLKWPNDVLLGDRKLAGILCEGRWHGEALHWLAVGVGVNVCNPIPAAVAPRAVSLAEWLPAVRRLDLLDRLVPALAGGSVASGEAALSERECAAFAERDWLSGRQLRSPAAGRARGLRPDGALLVDLGAATVAVREGHVELA